MTWLDQDFPKMLGAELHRPSPTFIAELAIEPTVVWDYSKQGGQTVQLDRYNYWGQPGSKESRQRTPDMTIGTASARGLNKSKVLVTLNEYTGPADPTDPDAPSSFRVSVENLMTAQRLLLDQSNLGVFHNSIGSLTLLQDYRQWRDRVFLLELYKSYSRGQSSGTQGGYYFPGERSEAQIASPGYTVSGTGNGSKARFSVKEDLLNVVRDMHKRNVPTFADGYFRAILDPEFVTHMRQDSDFREVARYPGMGQINPLQPYAAPNAINFQGSFAGYGQAANVAGAQTMPTGFLFEGVRFFVSTNIPEYSYNVAISGASGFSGSTPKSTRAAVGYFFGMQAIGLGIGGQNARVLINGNDDYGRFIQLIWQLYAGWEVLNFDFTTVAHSFIYSVA